MPNLYELMDDFADLQDAIDSGAAEEKIVGIIERMDAAKGSLRDKVDNVCRVVRNIEGHASAVKREKDRLQRREKALNNNKERLRAWVKTSMDLLDVPSIKTDVNTITLGEPGDPTVVITDIHEVPAEYVTKQDPKPDKKAILKAYKDDGEVVAGTSVLDGERVLTIR